MHNVVFDTNVFVSALITPLFLHADKYLLVISRDVVKELIGVLTYPHLAGKYAVTPAMVQDMLLKLKEHGTFITPKETLSLVSDAMDNHLLALAKEGHADYLVTGDRELLGLKRIGTADIIAPATFANVLER